MLCSLDTNILVYAADQDAAEHSKALAVVDSALGAPENWIIADQVVFEFYKALRNPHIFRNPLHATQAARHIRFLREETGVPFCCYELPFWKSILSSLEQNDTPYQRTHDIVLAGTLKANGVTRFYTRNTTDFADAGFEELINPIDG